MKLRTLLRGMTLVSALTWLGGCAYIIVGQRIHLEQTNALVRGTTTESEVLKLFGQPSSITRKEGEALTVYTFKDLAHTSFGIPFPLLQVGKAADKGTVLNVVFKNGVVVDYEVIKMQETY